MTHISEKKIVELAVKIRDESTVSDDDCKNMEHIQGCRDCERKFSLCLDLLDFLQPESLENYFRLSLKKQQEGGAVSERIKNVWYGLHIVWDKVNEVIQYAVDTVASGLPAFNAEESYAFARGGDTMLELTADQSIIRYEPRLRKLTVSLDNDILEGKELVAICADINHEAVRKMLVDNGHGMAEAVFTDIDGDSIELSIGEV